MAKSNFNEFRTNLMRTIRAAGNPNEVAICRNVLSETANFLSKNNAITGNLGTAAIENLSSDRIPIMNNSVNVVDDIGVDRVFDFVKACKVPAERQESVALEVLRILDNGVDRSAILAEEPSSKEHMSLESFAGRGGSMMLRHDQKVAMEAFGSDIDRLQSDNRLSIVLTILRSFTSIIDKMLPRVAEEGNVVTIKIPAPEVYDLSVSTNSVASVRNNPAARQPLVTLFKQPDPVSTVLKPVVPISANDTGAVKSLYNSTTHLATGVSSNLFDLTSQAGVYGYNAVDYTDLIAPGGNVSTLYILADHNASGTHTTELFSVNVLYHAQSVYTGNPNNMDSGDQQAIITTQTLLRVGSKNAAGGTSTLLSAYSDGVVQLNLQFNSTLNLKTGQIQGSGTVAPSLKPVGSATTVGAGTTTDFALITWTIVAFDAALYFDEENMRKTTTAVRMNYIERQFVIPMGRNFVVDYALNQQASEDVATTVNTVTSLGNSARGLQIMQSRLTDMYNSVQFEIANPELAAQVNSRMNSIAGTLCIPYVVVNTLDFSDVTIEVLRESERLAENHGRLRQRLLTALTTLCNNSLYLNNLEAGEKPVFKVLAAQPIADQLFGIIDYHNELNDKVTTANGCDYSMMLPNGHRLDIVKTNFVDYANTIMVVPIREVNPEHITSFGTIRDRGQYVAQYTPINNGGVARRVVANSREIVFPTNVIGAMITVTNLSTQLGPQN